MARPLLEATLTTRGARAGLSPGLHWRSIDRGVHLDYRKSRCGGQWLVRWYQKSKKSYRRSELGEADDVFDEGTLDFYAAAEAGKSAVKEARRKALADAQGPVPTVQLAIDNYLAVRHTRKKVIEDREVKADASSTLTKRVLADAAAQIGERPWHVQIYAPLSLLAPLKDLLADYPVPPVFDHFAGADGKLGPDQPGFSMIADLARAGRAYVKLSAPYRAFGEHSPADGVARLVRAFIAANPARMLWASDWPHSGAPSDKPLTATDIRPNYAIDDRQILADFLGWTSPAERKAIFVDNPARLYGFP